MVTSTMRRTPLPLNCTCDGRAPTCLACHAAHAVAMRVEHPDSLSVSMLRRRNPELSRREAALLVEITRYLDITFKARRRY